jgi:2-isopropylmalate synthase
VDACYKTIDRMTGVAPELVDYGLQSVTKGKDALGEVTVTLRHQGADVTGRGTSTDIIEASAKAYLNAINKLIATSARRADATKRRAPHP